MVQAETFQEPEMVMIDNNYGQHKSSETGA